MVAGLDCGPQGDTWYGEVKGRSSPRIHPCYCSFWCLSESSSLLLGHLAGCGCCFSCHRLDVVVVVVPVHVLKLTGDECDVDLHMEDENSTTSRQCEKAISIPRPSVSTIMHLR